MSVKVKYIATSHNLSRQTLSDRNNAVTTKPKRTIKNKENVPMNCLDPKKSKQIKRKASTRINLNEIKKVKVKDLPKNLDEITPKGSDKSDLKVTQIKKSQEDDSSKKKILESNISDKEVRISIERNNYVEDLLKKVTQQIKKTQEDDSLKKKIFESNISDKEVLISIERNNDVEDLLKNLITNKFRKKFVNSPKIQRTNPLAVYEFECDPNDRKCKPKSRKSLKRKLSISSSGDEDNSMKLVVRNLRRKLDKKKPILKQIKDIATKTKSSNEIHSIQSQPSVVAKSVKQVKNVAEPPKETDKIPLSLETQINSNQFNSKQGYLKDKPVKEAENIALLSKETLPTENIVIDDCSNHFDDLPASPEIQIDPEVDAIVDTVVDTVLDPVVLRVIDPVVQAQEEASDIAKSFEEDTSDEDSNALISTPSRIEIIRNLISRKPFKPATTKIYNSTMIQSNKTLGSPWRLDVSTVRKRPEHFSVKNTSFTPSYSLDMIDTSSNKKKPKTPETIMHSAEKHQTNILDFLTNPKLISKPKIQNVLFEDIPRTNSPRKALGILNYNQSTPLKPILNLKSPEIVNISRISPRKKSSDESLFGFTFLSDDENKENLPTKRLSPKKQKQLKINVPTRVNLNEIQKVVLKNQIEAPIGKFDLDFKATEIVVEEPNMDLDVGLFQEIREKEKPKNLKRFSRYYIRPHPKRKRRISVESEQSSGESDTEVTHVKRKQKVLASKEEVAEANRLAAHYNSMFEEIEQYPLCIE